MTSGRRLQTVAAVACVKTLLMVFNVAFWLTGIGVLAIGVWMQADLHKYLELTGNYHGATAYVLMGTGAAIIFVGSLACCCTAKGISTLLYLYSAFLIVVFVVELSAAVSGYAYRGKLSEGFRIGLNESLVSYKTDHNVEVMFDRLQSTLKCCGKDSYTDWFGTPWSEGIRSVPSSCCEVHPVRKCHHNRLGVRDNASDIYVTGCYKTVVSFVDTNIGTISGIALGLAFFQLIGVALSFCLAKHIDKAKYEQVD